MQLTKKRGLYEASRVVYLSTDEIAPNPQQPRKNFEPGAMRELAGSVARYGILQPLSVRRSETGYELVSGERRLRAAKLSGLGEVPCIVLEVDGQESSILALVENLQRRDLDFIEEAQGLKRLATIYGYSQEEIARLVGRSQPAVANKLRILRLSDETLRLIRESGLTERHARALLRVADEEDRMRILEKVIRERLNVATTEDLIEKFLALAEQKIPDAPAVRKKAKQPIYIIKDVRLFLNTVTRGMSIMQQSGIAAKFGKDENEEEIVLRIKIPKKRA